MSCDPQTHRMIALASRGKTRVMRLGQNRACDITFDEVLAMAQFCDLFLVDHPGPLTRGEPDLTLNPTPEMETSE